MNILGMGALELLIILLIAFVFLGPERMVDTARWLGKTVAQLRRMSAGLPEMLADTDLEVTSDRTVKCREAKTDEAPQGEVETDEAARGDAEDESAQSKVDGPVPFRQSSVKPKANEPDSPSEDGS